MKEIQGKIIDLVQRKIINGKLVISNGKIHSILPNDLPSDNYIIPGFIDAHVHVESSMLIPSEFARLAVCHGTIGTISDPHEIGNVLGVEGVKYMIENGAKTPFKFYFGAPSCVPATQFETAGATIGLDELKTLFEYPTVSYLAEMMNFPGVLNDDPAVLAKIKLAHSLGKPVDGHAPGLRGQDAKKYIDAGISTDHECFTLEEALEKLQYGMKIIIREGSAAKNFEALWPLIDSHTDQVMLCSDDKHPNDLVSSHINGLVKRAVAKGCDVMNVLQTASKNTIDHYQMDAGYLQIGQPADFCLVSDLINFDVAATYINGICVAEKGKSFITSVAATVINRFQCDPISEAALYLETYGKYFKVIEVADGQLITTKSTACFPYNDQYIAADPSNDILKIVVVNRYFNAPPAIGFVRNFGLKEGAIASCVAHDSHNIIAVGVSDASLAKAINLIIAEKGGVSLATETASMQVALPVAGIMSPKDGYLVASEYEAIDKHAKELGASLAAPFMTLSFCALLVIPELKLSDKGLFDGNEFKMTDLFEL